MKRVLKTLFLIAVALSATTLFGNQSPTAERKIRIGTYDNRAIAVAFVRWTENPMAAARTGHEKARCSDRQAQDDAWGQKEQRKVHRQGFGRVPVDDLLAHVKPGLARVSRERGLDAIAWFCDHTTERVELVDVTDDLVGLFDPSEETLRIVRELRRHEPLDLDEIECEDEH